MGGAKEEGAGGGGTAGHGDRACDRKWRWLQVWSQGAMGAIEFAIATGFGSGSDNCATTLVFMVIGGGDVLVLVPIL